MNLKQTIKVLEEHNRWRRDNNVPAKTKMAEPKVLGMALDRAIEELNKLLIPHVSIFVCPDCKGSNMVESNKREVWCNDCKKNFRENEC